MKSRRNQILAGAAILQAVVAAIVLWPRANAGAATAEPLLPNLASGLSGFTITNADDESLSLAKDGGTWVLPDADNYPADAEKVTELIDKLADVTRARLATRTDGSHRRLKVHPDEFERRLDMKLDGDTALYVGSSVGARSAHVRLDGADEVYLASDLSSWQMSPTENSWIDTVYLTIEKDDITHVLLRNDSGAMEFDKDAEAGWSLVGIADDEEFDEAKLTTLINRVSSLRMSKPLGREEKSEYGLAQPAAALTVTTKVGEDGENTYTLKVGARSSDEDDFVVRSSESMYHVEVSKWTAEDFTTRKREDFIKAPPETP